MLTVFDYFQIASVLIVLLIIVGRALSLRLGRSINPVAIGRGKKGFRFALELITVAGLIAWIFEIFLYALHYNLRIFPSPLDTQLINSPLAKLTGVVIITIGLIIFALAFVSFGDSWRIGFDLKTPGTLVTTGLFAVSRNPIYVFLDLWFLGIFLINGTLIFLIFAALAIAAMHYQILQEEDFLLNLYGPPYRDYLSRTGRYISLPR